MVYERIMNDDRLPNEVLNEAADELGHPTHGINPGH